MLMKKEIIDDNKRLREENKKLKALCDKYEEEHKTVFVEWKKTINIINELEKWLEEQLMYFNENNAQGGFSTNVEDLEIVKDKLQELRNANDKK